MEFFGRGVLWVNWEIKNTPEENFNDPFVDWGEEEEEGSDMETESRKMQDLGSGTDSHAMGYSGGSCDTNTNCLIFQQILSAGHS